MSITKAQLFEKVKARFVWAEIEGFGKVGIRSISEFRLSQRQASYRDQQTGQLLPDEVGKSNVHRLIDQVMLDENTPFFSDEDEQQLLEADSASLRPLYAAIDEFEGIAVGNRRGESKE